MRKVNKGLLIALVAVFATSFTGQGYLSVMPDSVTVARAEDGVEKTEEAAESKEVEEKVGEKEAKTLTTKIAKPDKYKNVILEIKPEEVYAAGFELGDILFVEVKEQKLEMPFCTIFSDVDTGSLVFLNNKNKEGVSQISIAINMGKFADVYGVTTGDEIKISLKEKAGYKDEYEIRHLERTNDIKDYNNDPVVYANFRKNDTTGIKPGVLYRSSSPINNEIHRAKYANELVEKAGIKTVLNLADAPDKIEEYAKKDDFASPYYKKLFDEGSVKPLDMSVDIGGKEFGEKLAEGLRFLNEHEGPYLVHCTEGKDRAGFVSAVLSGLMGASLDEIIEDYMVTYENYYHVEKGTGRYDKIANSNIVVSMTTIVAGLPKGTDIKGRDLSKDVESYLERIGLTKEEISMLKGHLGGKEEEDNVLHGTVMEIEKYGHASTDIPIKDMLAKGYEYGDMVKVTFDNGFELEAPFLDGYFVDKGAYLVRAYPGHETVGICINYGKLYEKAKVAVGDTLKIEMKEKKGYLDEYLIRNLKRTNKREDYASDEVFANFREIHFGKTVKKRLFRSSSPVNNEIGRAKYADELIKKAGIQTVINMADSPETIKKYMEKEDYASPYYKSLYSAGKVKTLNLGLAYQSPEFMAGVIDGLKFMAENEGPYLFHCTEGKDRTGFMGALLNAFMGATQDEIVSDYMTSYKNFFGVNREDNEKKYNLISKDVLGMLHHIAGTENLEGVDLAEKARAYMKQGGMSEEQINRLYQNLSKAEQKPAVVVDKTEKDDRQPKTGDTSRAATLAALIAAAGVIAALKKRQMGR